MRKRNKGFTLIELLGVAILLGVLGLIIFPIIVRTIENNRQSSVSQSARGIIRAAELYRGEPEQLGIFGGPYCVVYPCLEGYARIPFNLDKGEQWESGIIFEDSTTREITLENFYNGDYCINGNDEEIKNFRDNPGVLKAGNCE